LFSLLAASVGRNAMLESDGRIRATARSAQVEPAKQRRRPGREGNTATRNAQTMANASARRAEAEAGRPVFGAAAGKQVSSATAVKESADQHPYEFEIIQAALDIVGVFDPTGLADAASAGMSLSRGEWMEAAVSAIGALVPYAGDVLKAGKLPKIAKAIETALAYAKTNAEFAARVRPLLEMMADTLRKVPLTRVPKPLREAVARTRVSINSYLGRVNSVRDLDVLPLDELERMAGPAGKRRDFAQKQARYAQLKRSGAEDMEMTSLHGELANRELRRFLESDRKLTVLQKERVYAVEGTKGGWRVDTIAIDTKNKQILLYENKSFMDNSNSLDIAFSKAQELTTHMEDYIPPPLDYSKLSKPARREIEKLLEDLGDSVKDYTLQKRLSFHEPL